LGKREGDECDVAHVHSASFCDVGKGQNGSLTLLYEFFLKLLLLLLLLLLFVVPGLELRAYSLSHSTSPFLC
jgi:hypothetical protein